MKKQMSKLVVSALSACMAIGLCACGSTTSTDTSNTDTSDTKTETTDTAKDTSSEETATVAEDTGKTLNIEVWNEEFKSRITDHYPGYEKTDDTHGKIGDVTVNWIITPSDDNAYQNNLDSVLPGNADASEDKKVDIFLVEADYAQKYVSKDADVAMTMKDLGITDSDLSKQYSYTQDIVKDADGNMRASSWQACSAGLIYNRDAAKEVLGSDDPETVQQAVKDWDTYEETAKKMKAAGYKMSSTVNDTYRVYSNNVSKPWVDGTKVQIDDNMKAWVDNSKKEVDAGETGTAELWGDDWAKGFYPQGKVFCYFGPAWFFNFSMKADDSTSIAANGGWGFCVGPQSFYWGGTWICAAKGTDNPNLVKDIILKMTTDDSIMKEIAEKDSDCVNNKNVLKELAGSDDGNLAILGGQNPYQQLADGAEKVDMSNTSIYDQGCNEEFQAAMKNYFDGNASYDDALAQFNKAIVEKYPELTTE